ncbi:MAG: hypothetical protein WDM77_15170 [Steroidobacteraceae bacterium]
MEINLIHGNALDLADQAFLFKRTAREAALRHKMYATFMAKPHAKEPGSAMHIHQSVIDRKSGKNIFSNADGSPAQLFFAHIAGLQRYLPAAMALLCPNVNSYRRLTRHQTAPINTHWGYDNRTAGLRVPNSKAADRRSRIAAAARMPTVYRHGRLSGLRLPGDDRGPAAHRPDFGQRARSAPSGYRAPWMRHCVSCGPASRWSTCWVRPSWKPFSLVKEAEYEVFLQVISSWEREHLLLNV